MAEDEVEWTHEGARLELRRRRPFPKALIAVPLVVLAALGLGLLVAAPSDAVTDSLDACAVTDADPEACGAYEKGLLEGWPTSEEWLRTRKLTVCEGITFPSEIASLGVVESMPADHRFNRPFRELVRTVEAHVDEDIVCEMAERPPGPMVMTDSDFAREHRRYVAFRDRQMHYEIAEMREDAVFRATATRMGFLGGGVASIAFALLGGMVALVVGALVRRRRAGLLELTPRGVRFEGRWYARSEVARLGIEGSRVVLELASGRRIRSRAVPLETLELADDLGAAFGRLDAATEPEAVPDALRALLARQQAARTGS
ncbi:MAG: hypothetical protein H6737_23030 [Alphaproteobacteria bacterium]|nr:hypothetical protein [Alphaproteobacteria bacterium]